MPVTTLHADYIYALPDWQKMRDTLAGERAVKERCLAQNFRQAQPLTTITATTNYLPRLSGQTAQEYANYLGRAVFYNATARTVNGLVGAVFRVDPEIELTAELEPLRENSDTRETPLHLFAKTAFREVLAMGRYGVLVDLPANGAASVPYLCGYKCEDILNWRVEVVADDPQVTLVVLQECFTEPDPKDAFVHLVRTRYRVLELAEGRYQVRLYRLATTEDGREKTDQLIEESTVMPVRRGEPLDHIPFVFIGPTGIDPAVQQPPLLDLATLNLHHFRMSAERRNGLFVASIPQTIVIGDHSTATEGGQREGRRIGSAIAWELPAGADAKYLEFSGQGMGSLRDEMTDDEARMVILGARLLEPQKREAETAEALRLRQSGDTATLASVTDSVSWGVTLALGEAAEWTGANPDQNFITLNQDFVETVMSETDANLLVDRWQKGGATLDDTYYLLKRGGRIEPEVTPEQWKLKLEAQQAMPPAVAPGESPMDEEEDEDEQKKDEGDTEDEKEDDVHDG